jgi:hypothetical protein
VPPSRTTSLRLLTVALAVAFLAGAVVQVGRLVRHPLVAGADRPIPGGSIIDARNSPSLAYDPRHPDRVALTYRLDRPSFSAALEWSGDGGAVWHSTALPLPAGTDRPFGPDVAFAPDGTLYVSYVNLVGVGNVPGALWVARSTDGGRSLSPPVQVAGRLAFQARLAVGPDGTVYVTWMQAGDVGINRLVGGPNPVVVSRSVDNGRSFSAPVTASDPSRLRVGAASPAVDAQGRLYVLYEDFKDDRRDFENLEGPPAEHPFALVVTSSTDSGRTFSAGTEVNSDLVASHRFLVFLPEFPTLALDPRGQLYVAWADARNGDDDVFVSRSADRGRSWTPAQRVNDNRLGDGTAQYLPRLAVAPSGRVDVVFLDRRRDPRHNVMTDAFLASSNDQGRSFTNLRLSSRSFDSRVGPSTGDASPADYGSRLGLVSTNARALAAWTDSRRGTQDTGRQDIFVNHAGRRQATVGGWAIAAVLLVLAGTLGALAARRRTGPG